MCYLFIALAYILYLPKYNTLRSSRNLMQVKTHSVLRPIHRTAPRYGSIVVLVHQAYRSAIDNKRDTPVGLSQTVFLITALFVGALFLLTLTGKTGGYFNRESYPHRYAYLSYCTLRI